jgi:hypothetical protein
MELALEYAEQIINTVVLILIYWYYLFC